MRRKTNRRSKSGGLIKKLSRDKTTLGLVLVLVGAFVGYASFVYANYMDGVMIGVLMVGIGFAMMYVTADTWYCQNCGQRLGKLSKPRKCGRCGSNRMAQHDPGVGEAVRVKRQR